VWTPDNQGIGHGGGKTLFCRLMRYCLGEDKFAPEDQRDRIGQAFPGGWVGAEIVLKGIIWAVLRPLGNRRRHFAIPNRNLDEIILGDIPQTGIEPLLAAIEEQVLTPAVTDLVAAGKSGHTAWQTELAWLSRDQECRFDRVLDWRSKASDSDSPVRGLSETEKLDALRAFLNAIDPAEQTLRMEIAALVEQGKSKEQEIGHRAWSISNLRKQLQEKLTVSDDGLFEGDFGIEVLQQTAKNKLANTAGIECIGNTHEVEEARKEFEQAQKKVTDIAGEIAKYEAKIPLINCLITCIKGELPGLELKVANAQSYPCPICEVPIDRALAEGCKLSHKIPDLVMCRSRLEKREQDFREERERLEKAKSDLTQLKSASALAIQDEKQKEERYRKLQKLRDDRQNLWYLARKLVDDVDRLKLYRDQQQQAESCLSAIQVEIERGRERIGQLQRQNDVTVSNLAQKFDPIIRQLIGADAKGEIRLTGKGLDLSVQMGGDRSTAAIDSLKIVAFDLAALCMSIESKTKAPAFLIHDSPREADLGLSLYHRLFHLACDLEKAGSTPLFQYIVTTTTRPPPEYAQKPYLIAELHGSSSTERLLRRNL
jgi:predicted  nucleic acid-binding Zn-ribbon protein